MTIDISALETEQDLLNEIDDAMQNLLDGAEGRSVVVRMTLTGRGELNRFLGQPVVVDDLLAGRQRPVGRAAALRVVRTHRGRNSGGH